MVSCDVVFAAATDGLAISVANTRSKLRAVLMKSYRCRSTAPVNRLLSFGYVQRPFQHLNIHRRVRLGKLFST